MKDKSRHLLTSRTKQNKDWHRQKQKHKQKHKKTLKHKQKICPRAKASPRQGTPQGKASHEKRKREKRRRGKTINPILVSRYYKRHGTTMEKRNILRTTHTSLHKQTNSIFLSSPDHCWIFPHESVITKGMDRQEEKKEKRKFLWTANISTRKNSCGRQTSTFLSSTTKSHSLL